MNTLLKKQDRSEEEPFEGDITNLLFSGGTYQVEVYDPICKEKFWIFIQFKDQEEVKDAFCTCIASDKKRFCAHLSVAYKRIIGRFPLHIRFSNSLWNKLCTMGFKRHGIDPKILEKKGEGKYVFSGENRKIFFSIKVKTEKGKNLLDEMVFHRPEETEKTSLKFSNLSPEELALWKRGTPTQELQYELSFWSDLGKWMFLQQEFDYPYAITFNRPAPHLPNTVTLIFHDLDFTFYIAKVNWKEIIPALQSVQSPLTVHEFRGVSIEKMRYDPQERQFHIFSKIFEEKKRDDGIRLGKWEFLPDQGFMPIKKSPFLQKKVICHNELIDFLNDHWEAVEKYLEGTPFSTRLVSPRYTLYFDSKKSLHLLPYAFQKGDLTDDKTAFFGAWVYSKGKGFFRMKETIFGKMESVIAPEKVGDFIDQHQSWLNEYDGFQIHFSNVEFRLTYTFDLKNLIFTTKTFEQSDEILDFGDWLYMRGKGFYKKVSPRGLVRLSVGTKIQEKDISSFIHKNREELEYIKDFFSQVCPLKKGGLTLSIDHHGQIVIEPEYFYRPEYQGKEVHLLGDFAYVAGEGFSEISFPLFPEKYQQKISIDKDRETFFITFELGRLKPFLTKIDNRLKEPDTLTLKVKDIDKTEEKKWQIALAYVSEFGEVSANYIQKRMEEGHSYAMTEAGLIFFQRGRFDWIRDKEIVENDRLILSTLEWIHLCAIEGIQGGEISSEQQDRTTTFLEKFNTFEVEEDLNLDGLKSRLRPYQEWGVKWLWFLYSYGLSGLLCDDMGLGKTHQVMALIAAAFNGRGNKKVQYFVVCPTSVLYHWEELLQKFLPNVNVLVFYGKQRTLKSFNQNGEILLTSYGILRSEKELLSKLEFEIGIFDEIQVAKNTHSQTHQVLSMLRIRTKIGLSGTPIENRLFELKALFDIILPSYMPEATVYRELFVTPIEKYQQQEKRVLLSRLIAPFVLRRKKSEVLKDLPEKIEEIAYCFLSKEQQHLYRNAIERSQNVFTKDIGNSDKDVSYMHIFALFNTLKQICNHPALITKDIEHYRKHQSGKWDLFVELLEEARRSGQKLVVFSQYLDMMAIIKRYLDEEGIGYAMIQGSTKDRKKELHTFRDDPKCVVFIASLQAVGTGVDLTAASVVIHYDRWWNPAKENQATDRVHRIGQNRGVQVFKMVTKQSIEEHIHTLIEKKISLLEGVVGYDDKDQGKHFNREDLIQLLDQIKGDI